MNIKLSLSNEDLKDLLIEGYVKTHNMEITTYNEKPMDMSKIYRTIYPKIDVLLGIKKDIEKIGKRVF